MAKCVLCDFVEKSAKPDAKPFICYRCNPWSYQPADGGGFNVLTKHGNTWVKVDKLKQATRIANQLNHLFHIEQLIRAGDYVVLEAYIDSREQENEPGVRVDLDEEQVQRLRTLWETGEDERRWWQGEAMSRVFADTRFRFTDIAKAMAGYHLRVNLLKELFFVYKRFSKHRHDFPNLRHGHFAAAMRWPQEDALKWLAIANSEGLSVSAMIRAHGKHPTADAYLASRTEL